MNPLRPKQTCHCLRVRGGVTKRREASTKQREDSWSDLVEDRGDWHYLTMQRSNIVAPM